MSFLFAMDFYHVLPSNTSPDYYPNNNASQYSTPLNNPYVLNGNWEVGVIDVTFPTCVKTFNNDEMTLLDVPTIGDKVVTLPPISFADEVKAINFVNERIGNMNVVTFSCTPSKHIVLSLKKVKILFDDNLRDIFGFDKNEYIGPCTVTSARTFSLKRCIQFLYIYSNIGEYVRIGNTESPLLAVISFANINYDSTLAEKIFKTPMYIPVSQNRVSQIDIELYDGAGQLIPFVDDGVTTMRLHFRQT